MYATYTYTPYMYNIHICEQCIRDRVKGRDMRVYTYIYIYIIYIYIYIIYVYDYMNI